MRWVTRAGVHIDRAACAWLIRRFVDELAEFEFVAGPDEVSDGATPFDMRGVELGHHGGGCTFETILVKRLSMVLDDHDVLAVTQPVFEGLYAFFRRELLLPEGPP